MNEGKRELDQPKYDKSNDARGRDTSILRQGIWNVSPKTSKDTTQANCGQEARIEGLGGHV